MGYISNWQKKRDMKQIERLKKQRKIAEERAVRSERIGAERTKIAKARERSSKRGGFLNAVGKGVGKGLVQMGKNVGSNIAADVKKSDKKKFRGFKIGY